MSYVLILFLHAGIWSKGDSMTSTSVPGFTTREACEAAGQKADELVRSTKKEFRFICVQQ